MTWRDLAWVVVGVGNAFLIYFLIVRLRVLWRLLFGRKG